MTNQEDQKPQRPLNWFSALKWQGMRERDRANERLVNTCAYVWMGLLVVANLLRITTQIPEPFVFLIILISVVPGALFVRAYLKMLRDADEVLRQMQLEALAVGFGAGLVCGMTAMFLLPPGPAWGFATLIPMVLGFCVRVIIAGRNIARQSANDTEPNGGSE